MIAEPALDGFVLIVVACIIVTSMVALVWLRGEHDDGFGRRVATALALMLALWAPLFLEPFEYQVAPNLIGGAIAIAILLEFVVIVAFATRRYSAGGSAFFSGVLLVGAAWALAWGGYTAHVLEWHGLSSDQIGTGEQEPVVLPAVAFLMTPIVFTLGSIIGLVARALWTWRPKLLRQRYADS